MAETGTGAVEALGKEEIQRICAILDATSKNGNNVAIIEFGEKWSLLAIDLCNYWRKARWIKRLLSSKDLTLAAAFEEILGDWVEWNKEKATLENLLSLLVSNGLATFAELVSNEFSIEVGKDNGQEDSFTPIIINESESPVKKALGNSVILLEIFKMLSFKDQKQFRLVNRFWMIESLASFRKNRYLFIDGDEVAESEENLTMMKLLQVFDNESSEHNSYSLFNPPYLRCSLSGQLVRPFLNGIREEEDFFWKLFASKLTHLRLYKCSFYERSHLKTFQWILLKICKNLKDLHIDRSDISEDSSPNKIKAVKVETARQTCELTSLTIGYDEAGFISGKEMKKILQMLPKLNNLETCHVSNGICKSLLTPTNNGELIVLEKLRFPEEYTASRTALRNYIEKFPNSLKELETSVLFTSSEEKNFNIFAALAKCAKLEVLKLHFSSIRGLIDLEPHHSPFFNLGHITFSEVTKLFVKTSELIIEAFDFNSLSKLPNLTTLMISYDTMPTTAERGGSAKWLNEGAYLQYTPRGLRMEENAPQPPLTECSLLQRFSFDGWILDLNDLELLRGWFPNLTYLEAKLSNQTLPLVFDYWRNLKIISMLDDESLNDGGSDLDQDIIQSAMMEHENVKIDRPYRDYCDSREFDQFRK